MIHFHITATRIEAYRDSKFAKPNQRPEQIWLGTFFLNSIPGNLNFRVKYGKMVLLKLSDDLADKATSRELKKELIEWLRK